MNLPYSMLGGMVAQYGSYTKRVLRLCPVPFVIVTVSFGKAQYKYIIIMSFR